MLLAGISAAILRLPIRYVAIPGELSDLLTYPTRETLSAIFDAGVWGAGLGLAFVASAETLLCAAAVARMPIGARPTTTASSPPTASRTPYAVS